MQKFGEILVEAGGISEALLNQALEKQKVSGKLLGFVLDELGIVSQKDIVVVLARQFGFKTVQNLSQHNFSDELLALVDVDTAVLNLVS